MSLSLHLGILSSQGIGRAAVPESFQSNRDVPGGATPCCASLIFASFPLAPTALSTVGYGDLIPVKDTGTKVRAVGCGLDKPVSCAWQDPGEYLAH